MNRCTDKRIVVFSDLNIPLRDGVALAATIYSPREVARAPIVFAMTPYTRDRLHDRGLYFAEAGLIFVAVDVRGRGDSGGTFQPHFHEGDDGHDVTEWLASQNFCAGSVAMYGGSYLGYVQWVAAARFPAHLCTIVPTASPFPGVDVPFRNNIFAPYMVRWLAMVTGTADRPKMFGDMGSWSAAFSNHHAMGAAFRELDKAVGFPSDTFQEWLAHPEQGPYWDALNPSRCDYERICLPILTITGMYDGDQPGALEHYKQHMRHGSEQARRQHFLVIGPWDHVGCSNPKQQCEGVDFGKNSVIDMLQLHRDWYLWTLKGAPKPSFLEKNVAYFVAGADRWRYADSLEQATGSVWPLFLHADSNPTDVFRSGQLLAERVDSRGPAFYRFDPADASRAAFEGLSEEDTLTDQRMLFQSHGQYLVYHTPPLERDTELSGFFKLTAWISIDQPDTDIRVAIFEISIDGTSIRLSTDAVRARYREDLRLGKIIETKKPMRYIFDHFTFVSRLIRKRGRLRLVIGPNDSVKRQRNYGSGKAVASETVADARPVTVRLHHDAQYASVLEIPLGRADEKEIGDGGQMG